MADFAFTIMMAFALYGAMRLSQDINALAESEGGTMTAPPEPKPTEVD